MKKNIFFGMIICGLVVTAQAMDEDKSKLPLDEQLHWEVQNWRPERVEALLQQGANPNYHFKDYPNVLRYASAKVVPVLLKYGAKIRETISNSEFCPKGMEVSTEFEHRLKEAASSAYQVYGATYLWKNGPAEVWRPSNPHYKEYMEYVVARAENDKEVLKEFLVSEKYPQGLTQKEVLLGWVRAAEQEEAYMKKYRGPALEDVPWKINYIGEVVKELVEEHFTQDNNEGNQELIDNEGNQEFVADTDGNADGFFDNEQGNADGSDDQGIYYSQTLF